MSHTPTTKSPKGAAAGNCLLGCFGFPHSDNNNGGGIIISKENMKPLSSLDDSRVPKRRKWFSWARKQRSATKTVPLVEATTVVPEKPRRSWSKDVKRNKKGKTIISQPLVNHVDSPAPESTTPAAQKPSRTRSNRDQHIILGNKKSSANPTLDTIIEEATSHQESPPSATPTSTTSTEKVLTHSLSLPLNNKGNKLATTNYRGGDSPTTSKKSKDTVVATRVDSVVGMSIVMVVLLMMLLWGKLCAILCTSAWFYLVPRFRINDGSSKANMNDGSSSSMGDQIDVNSQSYKKRVILEGILERKNNHRNLLYSIPNN